ncbi:MAG: hypothetical protein DWQ47_10265 [Acidobacteria bacterium]|nr:MAG: hypothetical protein DWQ32_12680 [Acidobacteriota bacterium]REJ97969.1 MAG: hypothetical protein DWQ38_15480 [Acidobacteriota bacterium]REK16712.1 MAG: hypothetical protein DWQ43_00525 [Acidobacteriota bacterium]REK42623.1 MAG: hypothetical protein DWQ47_10265 [Acidobacteriota bacterium]
MRHFAPWRLCERNSLFELQIEEDLTAKDTKVFAKVEEELLGTLRYFAKTFALFAVKILPPLQTPIPR